MELTIHAHDLVIAALALLGVVLGAAAALALLVRTAGRRLPDVEESLATWLLIDAEAWRARARRREELAGSRPVLEAVPVAVEDSAA